MTEEYNPTDKAVAESINGKIKGGGAANSSIARVCGRKGIKPNTRPRASGLPAKQSHKPGAFHEDRVSLSFQHDAPLVSIMIAWIRNLCPII